MAYGVKFPSHEDFEKVLEEERANRSQDPQNNKPEPEASDLGGALVLIGIGCLILGAFLGQRECYVYFTCRDQETQTIALFVVGAILIAIGVNTKKSD